MALTLGESKDLPAYAGLIIIPDIRQKSRSFWEYSVENSLFFALPGRKGLKLPEESFRIRCQIIPSVHENAGKGVPMEHITSRHNPLMGHIRKLVGSAAYRWETGEFLCDSPKLLQEALLWQAEITAVVTISPLPRLPEHIRQVQVPEDVMASISPVKTPQGVLFTCRLPQAPLPQTLTGRRYVLLDGVQDPGNVGTILRTLDAFDADGLLLTGGCADPYGWKAVRSSMGAVFRRPIYSGTPEELAALLHRSGLPLYGAALREDTVDARQADYTRCTLAIGSEGRGLSREVLNLCDQTIRIPMSDRCESLNAAIAAAVLLWESWR